MCVRSLSRVPTQMKTKVSSYKIDSEPHLTCDIILANRHQSTMKCTWLRTNHHTTDNETHKNRTRARTFHTNGNAKIKMREQKANDKAKTTANEWKENTKRWKTLLVLFSFPCKNTLYLCVYSIGTSKRNAKTSCVSVLVRSTFIFLIRLFAISHCLCVFIFVLCALVAFCLFSSWHCQKTEWEHPFLHQNQNGIYGYMLYGYVCVWKSLKPYIISLVMPPHNDTTNAALNKIMGRKMNQQRFGIKSVNSMWCVLCTVAHDRV